MSKGTALGITFIVLFLVMFYVLWMIPIGASMTIHDWMRLFILEVPLQLAIHFLTEKKDGAGT